MTRPLHSTIGDARPLRLVFAGRVDYGKSTMIARLLAEVGYLPEGRIEEVQAASIRRGTGFEWSYVLDALQAERDQAVTIEMTRIQLQLSGRPFTLMDVPGHRRFLRNAVVGLADADAAVVLADAARPSDVSPDKPTYKVKIEGHHGIQVQLLRSTFYVLKCDAIPEDKGKPIARNEINKKGGLTVAWAGDVHQAWSIAKRCALTAEEIG